MQADMKFLKQRAHETFWAETEKLRMEKGVANNTLANWSLEGEKASSINTVSDSEQRLTIELKPFFFVDEILCKSDEI